MDSYALPAQAVAEPATLLATNIVQRALNLCVCVCSFFGGVRGRCKTCKIFNDCMHAIFHIFSIRHSFSVSVVVYVVVVAFAVWQTPVRNLLN